MAKQEKKIAITLSDNAKTIIDYLEANKVKATNAINKAIELHYADIFKKASAYKEKLDELNNEFKLKDSELETNKEVEWDKIRFATKDEMRLQAKEIIWLNKSNITPFLKTDDLKNFDEWIKANDIQSKNNAINYVTGVSASTKCYAFILKTNDESNEPKEDTNDTGGLENAI